MKGIMDMRRHTTMPTRIQKTPFGDVSLTSRWMRDRYYLVVRGDFKSLRWLFQNPKINFEKVGKQFRHAFPPAPVPVTVERDLQKICRRWQDKWNEKLQDYPNEIQQGSDEIITFQDLVIHLSSLRHKDLKASTLETDRYALKCWASEFDFQTPLNDLDFDMLQSAYERMCSRLKPSSSNRALAVLKTYLNWAVEESLLDHAPHKKLKKSKVLKSHRDVKWWTRKEVEIVLECARKIDAEISELRAICGFHTSELLIAMGCYMGLRYEEIIMQRWQDLELDCINLTTGDPTPVCHIVPHNGWEPKDGESRVVPIRKELFGILNKYRQESGYMLVPEKKCSKRGGTKRIYRYDPKKLWARVLKMAMSKGVSRITPYGMRHTFASNLIAVGVSDIKIAMWLGHANTEMLHQHYAHLRAYDDDINR